ncbi:hypothetical protein EBQ74_04520 [bacterium]|nr:hypothetical protein [bacterium]
MKWIVVGLLLNPLLGTTWLSLRRNLKESAVSTVVGMISFLQWVLSLSLAGFWLYGGGHPSEELFLVLYRYGEFSFELYYLVDHITIAGLITFTTVFLFVTRFSRHYLHRDLGYQRYFAVLLLFLLGLTVLVVAGNIDFLFAGWELLGVSSFLLIGFYHHRLNAIRNSLFVFGIYRFTDIGVILGAWLKKSVLEEGRRFFVLQSLDGLPKFQSIHSHADWLISVLIILAAIGKSAQFPLSFWLSRAMEGPTSSSAIFYGALSLHAGVFLLLRTYDLWHLSPAATALAMTIGVLTVIASGLFSQTQSNIKSRLAYAASLHVGLQFIELSLGYPNLALAHVIFHILVRCYQFLISPAVVNYALKVQNYSGLQKKHVRDRLFFSLPEKVQKSLYALAFNEGYFEHTIETWLVSPFATISQHLARFHPFFFFGSLVFSSVALICSFFHYQLFFSSNWGGIGSVLMLLLSISTFGEHRSIVTSWNSLSLANFMFGLFTLFADQGHFGASPWFLGSIFSFWMIGFLAINHLFLGSQTPSLDSFYAKSTTHPVSSHVLLLCFLGLSGFPLLPAFLGEDIVMESLVGPYSHYAISGVFALMLNGISAARLYTRVCWGPTSTV